MHLKKINFYLESAGYAGRTLFKPLKFDYFTLFHVHRHTKKPREEYSPAHVNAHRSARALCRRTHARTRKGWRRVRNSTAAACAPSNQPLEKGACRWHAAPHSTTRRAVLFSPSNIISKQKLKIFLLFQIIFIKFIDLSSKKLKIIFSKLIFCYNKRLIRATCHFRIFKHP